MKGKEKEKTGKKQATKIINTVINVVLIVAIVIAAVCTYMSFVTSTGNGEPPGIFGIKFLSIQTDLIVDTKVKDPSELRKDDIITYWTVINGERVLNTHRIINIYDGGNYLIFETKGDNNTNADPLTVHKSEIVGKYSFKIPAVGKVFDYLQTSKGFLLIVVIPVFLFFIFHLVQFFRTLFEYQNVKNRLKYEQERGRTEDLVEAQKAEQEKKDAERAALEAELREKLRAELLASMAQEKEAATAAEKTEGSTSSEDTKA